LLSEEKVLYFITRKARIFKKKFAARNLGGFAKSKCLQKRTAQNTALFIFLIFKRCCGVFSRL